jgi:hypothetical protein
MLMLSYFLGKFDGQAEVYIWWLRQTRQISLDGLIKRLISGQERNIWLDYGDPNQNITHYLMLHVFDFWAKTDVIASYATVQEEGDDENSSLVSENEFFNFLIDKYIKEDLDQIEDGISDLNRITESKIDDFFNRCVLADQRQTIQAEAFVQQTFIDTNASFFTDLYTPMRTGIVSKVQSVRESFQPKLQAIVSFRDTVQNYRDNPPVDLESLQTEAAGLEDGAEKEQLQAVIQREITRRANIDIALANLDSRILDLQTTRNVFLGKVLDYFHDFFQELPGEGRKNCLARLAAEESKRRIELATMEVEYQKDVHAAILALKASEAQSVIDANSIISSINDNTSIPSTEKSDIAIRIRNLFERFEITRVENTSDLKRNINETLGVNTSEKSMVRAFDLTYINDSGQTVPLTWSGHGEIHADGFVHHSIDFLLRMRHFLNRGYNTLGGDRPLPAVARKLDIQIPADFPKWSYNDDETNPLPMRWSQDAFLLTHMSVLDGSDSSYVSWFKPDNFQTPNPNVQNGIHPFNYIYTQLRMAQELMMWGEIPTGKNHNCNTQNCEQFDTSIVLSLFEQFTSLFEIKSEPERQIYQLVQRSGRGSPNLTRNLYLLRSLESNSSLFSKQFELLYDYSNHAYLKKIRRILQTRKSYAPPLG